MSIVTSIMRDNGNLILQLSRLGLDIKHYLGLDGQSKFRLCGVVGVNQDILDYLPLVIAGVDPDRYSSLLPWFYPA